MEVLYNLNNLIVCSSIGDEIALWGNLVLSNKQEETFDLVVVFKPSINEIDSFCNVCEEMKFNDVKYLNIETTQPYPEIKDISYKLDSLDRYDKVYTYNVRDSNKQNKYVSALVGYAFQGEVCVLSDLGVIDEIISSDERVFNKILNIINTHYFYMLETNLLDISRLTNTTLIQHINGLKLYRYYRGCVTWQVNKFDYKNPWGFKTAPYEIKRFEVELNALKYIKWKSLVEIGACEGFFTQKLISNFPDVNICAVEPDNYFFNELRTNLGSKIKLYNEDISTFFHKKRNCFDVIFISNVLYYCNKPPEELFDIDAKYYIVSHDRKYHEQILNFEFLSRGFKCIYVDSLRACIEKLEDIYVTKYGAEVRIWCPPKRSVL